MTSRWITVTPAYGRDYSSQAKAKADWLADKDFVETASGRYINRPQAEGVGVIIRYSNLRKTMTVQS